MWRLKHPPRPKRSSAQVGEMNGIERRFQAEVVDPLLGNGTVQRAYYETFNLRLAPRTDYRPDFALLFTDGLFVFVETKAGWVKDGEIKAHYTDDARVKIKVAAEIFPEFGFVGAMHHKNLRGGWSYECFTIDPIEWSQRLGLKV